MKSALILAAAALAAASPLAAAPPTAPNLAAFNLRAQTTTGTGSLQGLYASKLHPAADGSTIVIFSNDTSLRLQLSYKPYYAKVTKPAPAPGSEYNYLLHPPNVQPGQNTVKINVGPHAPEGGFEVFNQTVNGKSTLTMLLGVSDTGFDRVLGCPVTVQNGTESVEVLQFSFWSRTGKKPAGCQAAFLEIV